MRQDAKPYNSAFKDLTEQDPEALLQLIGALPPGATVRLLPREVSVQALLPDQPFEITHADGQHLAHVEAQTRYEPDIPSRIADYNVYLWVRYRLPVYSYVLVLTPRGLPDEPPVSLAIEAGWLRLIVSYQIVRLWELDAEAALNSGRENLLPFVPLMRGGLAELEKGAQALRQVESETRRRELALHFVMLGGLRYNREQIFDVLERMTMIPLEQLKESSVYQFFAEEERKKGIAQGLEQGLEEGLEQGRLEGMIAAAADLLRRLAARRFPGFEFGPELEQIRNPETLEQLCLELDELPDAEALRQRLTELVKE
ncbi:MAG TPA: hypothetical protein VNQ79_18205 [Blastocatellia bacterium]|nr:hypothetical protein [Blastocatellia bacterium]